MQLEQNSVRPALFVPPLRVRFPKETEQPIREDRARFEKVAPTLSTPRLRWQTYHPGVARPPDWIFGRLPLSSYRDHGTTWKLARTAWQPSADREFSQPG